MKISKNTLSLMTILTLLSTSLIYAGGGPGTSGGLTLLEPTGAKPSSMGEAFSAVGNDIAAFGYNPASLRSLEGGQASFMYNRGMAEDGYGQFIMGMPTQGGNGWGLSVGYYNGGKFDLTEEPTPGNFTTRSVTAERDMTVSLGYATAWNGVEVGVTGKYLSAELVEQYKASAFAGDVGIQIPVGSRLRLGGAVRNVGTELKFINQGDKLPTNVSGGLSFIALPGRYQTTLLMDAPYYVNEAEVRPGVGIETLVGPLALRAGYKGGNGLQEFSFGAGFVLGRSSLDYSFGMVDQLNAEHRVSLNMAFGEPKGVSREIVRRREPVEVERVVRTSEEGTARTAVAFPDRKHSLGEMKGSESVRRVYTVKSGDTLSKIAKRYYGDPKEWKKIYTANRHLLDDSKSLEIGQKIMLP